MITVITQVRTGRWFPDWPWDGGGDATVHLFPHANSDATAVTIRAVDHYRCVSDWIGLENQWLYTCQCWTLNNGRANKGMRAKNVPTDNQTVRWLITWNTDSVRVIINVISKLTDNGHIGVTGYGLKRWRFGWHFAPEASGRFEWNRSQNQLAIIRFVQLETDKKQMRQSVSGISNFGIKIFNEDEDGADD